MSMRKRRPTTLTMAHGLMIVAGLATFVTVGSALRARGATVTILAAASDAPVGRPSRELVVTTVEVPADLAFVGSFARPGDLSQNQMLGRAVRAGDPIMASDLVPVGESVLARTATIPVDAVVIEGLGLVVGDRIDILAETAGAGSQYVLTDLRVNRLPVRPASDAFTRDRGDAYVTVEVDGAGALALNDARQLGPIGIIRSTGAPAIDRSGADGS